MRWHHAYTSHDGLVRHAPDYEAWAHVDETWLDFATDPQNLRLTIALDRVNLFS